MKRKSVWLALIAVAAFNLWLSLPIPQPVIPRSALAQPVDEPQAAVPVQFVPTRAEPRPVQTTAAAVATQAPDIQAQLERLMAPPRFHPRPADEWQGMLVDLNEPPPCETHAQCGLARSCQNNRCVPCNADRECAGAEACVLDHCVLVQRVACRRRSDCGRDSMCLLSGYSNGPRGNEDMRAQCVDIAGGEGSTGTAPTEPPAKDTRPALPDDDLLDRARNAAQ